MQKEHFTGKSYYYKKFLITLKALKEHHHPLHQQVLENIIAINKYSPEFINGINSDFVLSSPSDFANY